MQILDDKERNFFSVSIFFFPDNLRRYSVSVNIDPLRGEVTTKKLGVLKKPLIFSVSRGLYDEQLHLLPSHTHTHTTLHSIVTYLVSNGFVLYIHIDLLLL